MHEFTRAIALDDIRIRSGGDGRTVEAYAAVFDSPQEINRLDEGHYIEVNSPAAFNKTIKDRGGRFPIVYNHGFTLAGTASERGSVPIGVSTEVRIDKKGVLTVARYNRTEQADEVLEAIRNGDITGQSYGGRFIKSNPETRGTYRPNRDGSLRTVTRLEIAMREFGPTPFPQYADATILGVRTLSLMQQLNSLTTSQIEEPEATDDTSQEAVVRADEPGDHHSARPTRDRIKAFRIARGIGVPESGEAN